MVCEWPELPPGYLFISHEKTKSPLYRRNAAGMPQFAGYWWHDEDLDVAIERGFKAWINPGTYKESART